MAQAQAGSNFLALPDDLRERLLALIPHDSLTAAALVCRAFHAVISGPQFPALRQRFGGFAAPGPLIVAVKETELPWQDMARAAHEQFIFSFRIVEAIPHQGRIVVFLSNGAAFERATDGSWSRHEVAEGTIPDNGYDSMHAASIPIG